jgi:ABC-type multidrug transport system fused ATPase/permease subunit
MTKEMLKLDKSLIVIVFLGAISAVGIDYALLYLPKLVINDIMNEVDWIQLLLSISIITLIILSFRIIDTWCTHHRAYRFNLIRMSMILKKVHKMNTMNYEYLENPDIMNLSQLAHNALSNYEGVQGLMFRVYYIFIDIVKMGIAITILLQVKPWLILIVFLLSFLHFIFFNKNIVKDKENTWNKLAPLSRKISYLDGVNSDFSYGKDIRLQRMGNFLSKKQSDIHQDAHHYVFFSKRRWGYFGVFTNLINSLLELLMYIILAYEVMDGRINIADFTLYAGTVYAFFTSLSGFLYGVAHTRRCSLYTNDYRSFMELQYRDRPAKRSIEEIKHYSFEFKQVSFKYPNQEAYALKDLSIKLDQGSKLAVVGLNGAGKTTFIKLLLRLYEPQSGKIYVDGIDINEFDRNEYYQLFAPLFQEVEVFAFPIAENVSMKSQSMTDRKKAFDSLCLAGLEEKLKHLKKGIDTELLKVFDEDGIDLSGGEKQKLALARAIYKDAPVIVLDEPTSAMDALAEYQLYQDFNQIMMDKTSIYISHRLSSTRFCDNIALFKDGSLLEYGSHMELMDQDMEYRHLFDIQSTYYKEESIDAI